jgi:hypothetical protein
VSSAHNQIIVFLNALVEDSDPLITSIARDERGLENFWEAGSPPFPLSGDRSLGWRVNDDLGIWADSPYTETHSGITSPTAAGFLA